jgi:uncharacterized protein (UPF0216 family)
VSAAEVIEQIEQLPREERQRVRDFMMLDSPAETGRTGQERQIPDEEFKRLAGKVFEQHDSLFRRLAQ